MAKSCCAVVGVIGFPLQVYDTLELIHTSSVKPNMQSKTCVNITEKYFSLGDFRKSRFFSSREGRDFRGTELNPQTNTTMTTIKENRGNRD